MEVVVEGERVAADTREFDAIVGPWIEPGYRLAVAMLRDPVEAQDAVQEAAVKAWRSLERLRDSNQARPWFLSIVANQCRSTMRRRWWSVVGVPSREGGLARPYGKHPQAQHSAVASRRSRAVPVSPWTFVRTHTGRSG
jgi:DNA-directed RNA polymerase specialized sigma24 family protein